MFNMCRWGWGSTKGAVFLTVTQRDSADTGFFLAHASAVTSRITAVQGLITPREFSGWSVTHMTSFHNPLDKTHKVALPSFQRMEEYQMATLANVGNPNYSGGRYQEDYGG
jgi:hypothetical protein